MVDFNNETTVAQAPKQVLTIMILEMYNNVLLAIETYNNLGANRQQSDFTVLKSRLNTLYLFQRLALIQYFEKNEAAKKTLQELNKISTYDEFLEAFTLINDWLTEKKLIRVDDFVQYDFTDPFLDNKMKGFN